MTASRFSWVFEASPSLIAVRWYMAASPEALMLETARPWTRPYGISGYRCLGFRLSGRHLPVAEPSPLLAELKDLDLRPCRPHDKALHHAVQHLKSKFCLSDFARFCKRNRVARPPDPRDQSAVSCSRNLASTALRPPWVGAARCRSRRPRSPPAIGQTSIRVSCSFDARQH